MLQPVLIATATTATIGLTATTAITAFMVSLSTVISCVVKGVHSEYVYKTMEASVDGIIDVKIDEEGGEVKNFMRIRKMRNVGYDSRWCLLRVGDDFEVTVEK